MSNILRSIKKMIKKFHPYDNLNMGLIKQYSLIIPRDELDYWLERNWVEAPHFRSFHYAPQPTETVILGRPITLLEVDKQILIGKKIVDYKTYYGTYGMGGPGFLGFVLDDRQETSTDKVDKNRNVLVYAVWNSGQYTLVDDRVIECSPQYYQNYHPWLSQFADENIESWDDLAPILLESTIDQIDLYSEKCIIIASKDGKTHNIEFLKNDPRLPPHGNSKPRGDAFNSGAIGEYMLLQQEKAVLHV